MRMIRRISTLLLLIGLVSVGMAQPTVDAIVVYEAHNILGQDYALVHESIVLTSQEPSVEHGNNPTNQFVVPISESDVGGFQLLQLIAPDYWDVWVALDPIYVLTAQNPLAECAETAQLVCGEAVCWVCVTEVSCSFGCQDGAGNCEAAPPCGPDNDTPTGCVFCY